MGGSEAVSLQGLERLSRDESEVAFLTQTVGRQYEHFVHEWEPQEGEREKGGKGE